MIFFFFFGLLILGIFSFAMYWIFKNKMRAKIFLGAVGGLVLFGIINEIFFTDHSMQFLRSKAYRSMFLVKNIDVTDEALQKIIKNKILNEVKKDFIPNRKKYLEYSEDSTKAYYYYQLRYYDYTDGLFGSGTSYYLDHKEDDGGPTSTHFLDDVEDDKIAYFSIETYDNDPEKYYGIFQWRNSYKNDTIKLTSDPPLSYLGTIGSEEIVAHLTQTETEISGYYYYQNEGIDIPLSGKTAGGEMILRDGSGRNHNAEFRLKTVSGKKLAGSWINTRTKKAVPVNLQLTKESIPQIPKTILGTYQNDDMNSCPISLTISKKDGKYFYTVRNASLNKSGVVNFYRDVDRRSVEVILKDIKWAENHGLLTTDDEPIPPDIDGYLDKDGRISIQNSGNSTSFYKKFNCNAEYLTLIKKK